jgi:hypothetical protein
MLVTERSQSGEAEVLPDEAGKSVFITVVGLSPRKRTKSRFRYTLPPTVMEHSRDARRCPPTSQKQVVPMPGT